MANANITIPEDAIAELVSRAIFEGIGQDTRDLVIQQAVKYLVTQPPSTGYGSRSEPTPLQEAFNQAARRAVHGAVEEVLTENAEFQQQLRAVVNDQVRTMLDENYDIGAAVTEALVTVMTQREQERRYS